MKPAARRPDPKLLRIHSVFEGRWIGETMGYEMAAHLWDISRRNALLILKTRWEGEKQAAKITGHGIRGETAFHIYKKKFKAILLDQQHFIVPGWVAHPDKAGARLDVVFSRPGLAELKAVQVWEKYKASLDETPPA